MSSLPRRAALRIGQALGRVKGVRCLVCGNESEEFLPSIPTGRPNARCRYCDANERHRLFWVLLQERTNLFNGDAGAAGSAAGSGANSSAPTKLLYFAPEPFVETKLRTLPGLEITTCDLFRSDVDVQADITDLPFADGDFDAIICSHVLEHVPDDAQAMRELRRVIKPTGWAVISVPLSPGRKVTFEDLSVTDPQERLRLFGQDDHLRVYGADFKDKLESVGFSVTNLSTKDLKLGNAKRYGVPKGYYLPYCTPR